VIHPTAEIEQGAQVGPNTRVWHFVHIRAGAHIGDNCSLGYGVYVDADVVIGDNVKLQNRVSVYHGVTLEDGVFVGPHVAFTNDKHPRAISSDGSLIAADEWTPEPTTVRHGASIGAAAVILPGVTIGRWAMVGANALVTKDVPDHGLVFGSPARLVGFACKCGQRLRPEGRLWVCPACHEVYETLLPPESLHD
jgi:UDP-2-acetamido-3-amino-2,3-dideoxy-glucuronate N-acetyltransferase